MLQCLCCYYNVTMFMLLLQCYMTDTCQCYMTDTYQCYMTDTCHRRNLS